MRHRATSAVCAVLALAGCGSSGSDEAVRATFDRGVGQIRASHNYTALSGQLRQTIAHLRGEVASSEATRRGRRLAIAGFEQTLRGVEAQIDFTENDSGNIEAATRDARRANRYEERGAKLLRRAGRALDVTVGELRGY
jgi:hypothetical protein